MKRLLIAGIVLLLPLLFAESDEVQEGIDALLETIDLSEWDEWAKTYGEDGAMLPSEYLAALAESALPSADLTPDSLWTRIRPSVRTAAVKTAFLIGLAAIGAAVHGLSTASSIGETAETAFRICASGAVLLLSFAEIRIAMSAVASTARTAELLLPVIVGYLTLIGAKNTALLLPTSNLLFSELVIRAIQVWVAPAAVIGGVLLALDTGGSGRLASIGRLLQRASKWILGIVCSLFLLITTVRSVAAGSADGLLIKSAKLAAGSIPSIGSLLSESMDTAFHCLGFVKNVLGLTGCIVLVSVSLKPAMSVLMTRSALKASALLAEPLSGKPYADLLRGMGDTLQILLLSELAAAAMAIMLLAPVFGTA